MVITLIVVGGKLHFVLLVGLAVACAIGVAGILGIIMPMVCNRLGADPAVSAGPFVTIINDLVSITVYMVLAVVIL